MAPKEFRRKNLRRRLWLGYLAAITWVLLPLYASPLAFLLPLEVADVEAILSAGAAVLGPAAWYVAARGGPITLTPPEVLYGLRGAADSRLLRRSALSQALSVWSIGFLAAAVLYVMTATATPVEPQRYALMSLTGGLILSAGFALSLSWPCLPILIRVLLSIVALGLGFDAFEGGIDGGTLAALGALNLVPIGAWLWRIDRFSLPRAWRRAEGLADVQSALALADLRSAILSLRRAVDGPRVDRNLARTSQLAPALWRPLRSLSTLPNAAAGRIVLSVIASSVLLGVMPNPRAALLAAGFALLVMVVDTTASVGSLCSAMTLLRSGARKPRAAITAELLVGSAASVALAALAWLPSRGSGGVGFIPWLMLAFATALAAGLQARIGQPDVTRLLNSVGPELLGAFLVLRGLLFVLVWFLAVSAAAASATLPPVVWAAVWIMVIAGTAIAALKPPANLRP